MDKETNQKIALFRFSLIAPIINSTFSENSITEYLETICAKKYMVPGLGEKEYTPATLRFWLRDYKTYGFDGLLPKVRCDFGKSRALTKEQKDFIVSLKKENPKYSAKFIYNTMLVKGIAVSDSISLSTVTRFIQKNNLKTKQLEPVDRRAFEMECPNDCWQADTSVGPYLTIDGKRKKTYLIMFIDDCSRLIIHGKFFFEENFVNLEEVLKKSIASRGIPKKIFVDNGAVYHSIQLQMICASLGTILCYAKAYSPESKGKVERAFRTIKDKWMNIMDWNKIASIYELNEMFNSFLELNYNNQIHSSIKMKPMDKFMEYINNIKFINSKETLDNIFLHRVTRKVKNDATISLNSMLFEAPQQYINQNINIRYEATNLEKAYIFDKTEKLIHTIYPVKKVDNSKIKRTSINFSEFKNQEDFNHV